MKVTALMENATSSGRFCASHGLSLFLETEAGNVLFDMGPDERFIDNAKAMGVDVRDVQFSVLSHGHDDHCGGLRAFLEYTADQPNPAPVYVNEHAFEPHYVKTPVGAKYIGADAALEENERIHGVGSCSELSDGLLLFSGVRPHFPLAESNKSLLERREGSLCSDSFAHEQSLIVTEGCRHILVSGCSHCGIINIIDCAEQLVGAPMDAVFGGFHLMDPSSGLIEDIDLTRKTAAALASRKARYWTFHCTGLSAYSVLRDVLGERINYLYVGASAEV